MDTQKLLNVPLYPTPLLPREVGGRGRAAPHDEGKNLAVHIAASVPDAAPAARDGRAAAAAQQEGCSDGGAGEQHARQKGKQAGDGKEREEEGKAGFSRTSGSGAGGAHLEQ